ncbi:MAG: hypothetical protein FJ344_07455 [Sphingomonadales bacterium]|nr:hypothetical protein [Sphingomonadales bacterium]
MFEQGFFYVLGDILQKVIFTYSFTGVKQGNQGDFRTCLILGFGCSRFVQPVYGSQKIRRHSLVACLFKPTGRRAARLFDRKADVVAFWLVIHAESWFLKFKEKERDGANS